MERRQRSHLFGKRRQIRRIHAAFCVFVCYANLEQYAQLRTAPSFTSRTVQSPRQSRIVHRVHAVKQSGCPRRFVTLQMSNQVPLRVRQIAEPTALPFPLLYAVFSEIAQTRHIRRSNRLRRMCLRNADQRDLCALAASPVRSRGNTFPNPRQIFEHRLHAHARLTDSHLRPCLAASIPFLLRLLWLFPRYHVPHCGPSRLPVNYLPACSHLQANSSPSKASTAAANALNSICLRKP